MRFRLNPNESARDNLWRCMDRCFHLLAARYKVHLPQEEFDDLKQTIMLRAVDNFMRLKIGEHRYNRKVDFFANCYSSTWAVFTYQLNEFYENKKRLMEAINLDDTIEESDGSSRKYSEVIPSEALSALGTYSKKYNHHKSKNPNEVKGRGILYERAVDAAYEDYEAECIELGVTPVDFGRFREVNGY